MGGIFLCHSLREAAQTALLCTLSTCYLYHNNYSVPGKLGIQSAHKEQLMCTSISFEKFEYERDQAMENKKFCFFPMCLDFRSHPCFCGTIAPNILKFPIIPKKVSVTTSLMSQEILTEVHCDAQIWSSAAPWAGQVKQVHLRGNGCWDPPYLGMQNGYGELLKAFKSEITGEKAG